MVANLKLLFGFTFFIIWLVACGKVDNTCLDRIDYSNNEINKGINLDTLFTEPSQEELQKVLDNWKDFDMSSDAIEEIDSYELYADRDIIVIANLAEGRKHYGAIIFPKNYSSQQTYPLMLWAEGLSQDKPLVDAHNGYGVRFSKLVPNHFILIPSFRGQSLKSKNAIYCSDGFFGDAYNGATDDALRLMQVALDLYDSTIDKEKISIYGGSRGGTVALLAGIRFPFINKVVSQSGPTQFHNRWCYDSYGFQFRYQFLNEKKPISELRQQLIKCSPIYFIDQIKAKLFVVHGKDDPVVPVWNAQNIVDARGPENLKFMFTNEGHSVSAARDVAEWVREE